LKKKFRVIHSELINLGTNPTDYAANSVRSSQIATFIDEVSLKRAKTNAHLFNFSCTPAITDQVAPLPVEIRTADSPAPRFSTRTCTAIRSIMAAT